MLQQMRENFTGKFALALLVMIAVSFVFFGLNYSFLGSQYAAKVDGEEIDLAVFEGAYRNAVNANPQLATAAGEVRAGVRRNILDQLIGQQLLENFLDESGYRVNDEQVMRYIREEPSFQVDGEFNMETYRTFLLERGRNPIEFENEQRAALRSRQLQLALGATAIVTPAEYRRYLNLVAEQRVVTVASIDESAVSDEITVTDEMIESFYDDNPTLYQLPETADLEYVEVRRDAVANDVEVSDKELQDHYEVSQGRFLQDEQREARHILVLFGGDEDAAETEANEILARVLAGESFEELAAELSDDGGSASRGGSLGTVTSEQLDPDLASEIFSMSEGEVSGPVKSDFGFHVVRLDAILERGALPLDQVRAELLGELRERKSDELFRELERSLSDALFDSDDLDVIAEQVGLEVKSIDAFSREGGGDIGANQVVIDAIFDDAVLTGGQVTDIIEVDANRSALFRVTNYQEATRQPLADVRDEVTQALRTQQAEILMSNRAEQVMAVIDAGGDFGQAAEEAGFTMTSAQILSRSDQNVDQMLMFDVFAAGKPRDDKPVYGRVRSLDGSYKVYTLDAVLPGRPESIPLAERDEGKLMLAQQSGFGDLQAFVLALYENADIVINEDLLAATDMFQ